MADEDHDDMDDLEWVPPSVAEQKVLTARRERSDKISRLMGDYMLKGYKMLASSCSSCGTVELQDKQNRTYCVGCEEVDCEENSKDNPAVNSQAARNQIAESNFVREIESQIIPDQQGRNEVVVEEVVQSRSVSQRHADPTMFMHTPSLLRSSRTSNNAIHPTSLMHSSLDAIFIKMNSATQTLTETDDIDTSRQLVGLIKECADCVLSLKHASMAHQ
jgi:uncharacterized Zn finger protein (UPF0148 family)